MKKFNELDAEVKFAGIFGVIAIVAIFIEMVLGGFSAEAITSGIKDLAGTIVAVLVFIIAVKGMRTDTNRTFVEYYEEKMELLVKKYSPLLKKTEMAKKENLTANDINKAKKLETKECYDLNTNAGALYGDNNGRIARFCEISKENCKDIKFSLNYTMFGYTEKNEKNQLIMQIIGQKIRGFLLNFINTHYPDGDVHSVEFDSTNLDINVNFKRILKSEKDAKMLVEIIDCVLMNCLILSGREIKISNEH